MLCFRQIEFGPMDTSDICCNDYLLFAMETSCVNRFFRQIKLNHRVS